MRQLLSLVLALTLLARAVEADTPNVATQVSAIPEGARVELRLKNKEKLRGTKGTVSETGFTLVSTPGPDRQIAFDDIASVKLHKSHTTRNVLIIVGIGVVATVGIIAAVALRCAPLGCNSKL
jgi:hypothetical protein